MRNILFLLLVVSLLTCERDRSPSAPSSDAPVISYGYSFGECLGYCFREVVIQDAEATYTKSGWPDVDPLVLNEKLSVSEWSRLQQAINWPDFTALPDVIGCPDCADGGAEWININYPDTSKKVTFEYGSTPKGQGELLEILSTIQTRMEEKLDG